MNEIRLHQDDSERRLTAVEFQQLTTMPAAVDWFANIDNHAPAVPTKPTWKTFAVSSGWSVRTSFASSRARTCSPGGPQLEKRGLAGATIHRKLAALASLFDHVLESNAVAGGNPVHGVKRPRTEINEGETPTLGDHQAKMLLDAPDASTLKGARDRAILAVLLYHGLRREEAAQLLVNHLVERRGIKYLVVHGKGEKIRYLPVHPVAMDRLHTYWSARGITWSTPRCRCLCPYVTGPKGRGHGHGLRATAATNALEHGQTLPRSRLG